MLQDVLERGGSAEAEIALEAPRGYRLACLRVHPLWESGAVAGAIAVVRDVTEDVRVRRELEERATFDELTRCQNRASILQALQLELESRPGRTGLIYVDVDGFKDINDTHGHATGDRLLVTLVERIRAAIAPNDDIGRLGGDEFLVLLRDLPKPSTAMDVAGRIRRSLELPVAFDKASVRLRASLGVVCPSSSSASMSDLIREADRAMYRSKRQGRGVPVAGEGAGSERRSSLRRSRRSGPARPRTFPGTTGRHKL